MILKPFHDESIAQFAYLIGCRTTGEAVVVDPTIDIQPYIDAAAAEGLRILGVVETHIHADYVSGGRALALAEGATIHVSGEGGPDWQYAFAGEPGVTVLRDGDVIECGRLRLRAVHTPGHTPEHLMFVITDTSVSPEPRGAFTGDFLFVGDVGRPDLLETAAGQTGTMDVGARQLLRSVRRLATLPDYLLIWPGHGSGSLCGKSLSAVPASSLGYERRTNWALRQMAEDEFLASVIADQPDPPMYFAEMKRVNTSGAPAWHAAPPPPSMGAEDLEAVVAADSLIVDARADGVEASLPGAIVVPLGRGFSMWAGAVLPADVPLVLLADDQAAAEAARRTLALIGRQTASHWASSQALEEYRLRGGRMAVVPTAEQPDGRQRIVDVRTTAEWRAGHLESAVHAPLARLPEHVAAFDRATPLLVYCQAGVRAAVAATTLRRMGFDVTRLEGGLDGYDERQQPPG